MCFRDEQVYTPKGIKRLSRKAHRDLRKGGQGEASAEFFPPLSHLGWEKWADEWTKGLGVVTFIQPHEQHEALYLLIVRVK